MTNKPVFTETESKTHFTCDECRRVFPRITPPEELLQEQLENFGAEVRSDDRLSLCDDCYADFKLYWDALPAETRKEMLRRGGYG